MVMAYGKVVLAAAIFALLGAVPIAYLGLFSIANGWLHCTPSPCTIGLPELFTIWIICFIPTLILFSVIYLIVRAVAD